MRRLEEMQQVLGGEGFSLLPNGKSAASNLQGNVKRKKKPEVIQQKRME